MLFPAPTQMCHMLRAKTFFWKSKSQIWHFQENLNWLMSLSSVHDVAVEWLLKTSISPDLERLSWPINQKLADWFRKQLWHQSHMTLTRYQIYQFLEMLGHDDFIHMRHLKISTFFDQKGGHYPNMVSKYINMTCLFTRFWWHPCNVILK